jgi:hypothetical protein
MVNLVRLFVFFDDFSELGWIEQKLFVDVILSPLNNASDETVKLKVAGYPGRIYYGKIDPGKIDTVGLGFYQLYKSQEIQTSEAAAINYLERLLTTRFRGFHEELSEYFEPTTPLADHYRLLFEVTLNVPRLIGYVRHYCYLDRVSKRQLITGASIRLAAQKYYETIIAQYFDRMNRFAMEPFERKLDRHNQQQLLRYLVDEARNVRRGISTGQTGGKYFEGLTNPPVSHFAVTPSMEKLLSALELNFLVTKYHEMRDKSGKDVSIYAFLMGSAKPNDFRGAIQGAVGMIGAISCSAASTLTQPYSSFSRRIKPSAVTTAEPALGWKRERRSSSINGAVRSVRREPASSFR